MDKSEVNAVRTLKSVGVVKRSPLHSTRTPSDHRGSGTPQGSDWDSGSSVVWYSKQGGSESSVRSRSLSLPGDRNPRSGQVWQTVSRRQAGRGSGSPLTGFGTSQSSGSGLSRQPAQDFFLVVVNQSVYLHGGGPDRLLCPCICIPGTRSLCRSPTCSSS